MPNSFFPCLLSTRGLKVTTLQHSLESVGPFFPLAQAEELIYPKAELSRYKRSQCPWRRQRSSGWSFLLLCTGRRPSDGIPPYATQAHDTDLPLDYYFTMTSMSSTIYTASHQSSRGIKASAPRELQPTGSSATPKHTPPTNPVTQAAPSSTSDSSDSSRQLLECTTTNPACASSSFIRDESNSAHA